MVDKFCDQNESNERFPSLRFQLALIMMASAATGEWLCQCRIMEKQDLNSRVTSRRFIWKVEVIKDLMFRAQPLSASDLNTEVTGSRSRSVLVMEFT